MVKRGLRAFIADESGTNAMEYSLMAAILAIGLILVYTVFGENLKALFGASETGAGGAFTNAQGQL